MTKAKAGYQRQFSNHQKERNLYRNQRRESRNQCRFPAHAKMPPATVHLAFRAVSVQQQLFFVGRGAASPSGGEAHWRGPLSAGPVGQAPTAPGEAASPGGGRADLASPVPSRREALPIIRSQGVAASSGGGRARRLLARRQAPRVPCRACRH